MRLARGRVLDVGCGAGRVALYLQERGHEVVGIDLSPLTVDVARRRGVKNARELAVTQVSRKIGRFDTIVMFGNNFGLMGGKRRAPWLLRRFRSITNEDARILAESVNDRGFRRDLDRARGFCAAHTHDVLAADRRESGGTVAAAILFGAVANVRGQELEGAVSQRGRTRSNRLAASGRPPDCPACAESAAAEGHARSAAVRVARATRSGGRDRRRAPDRPEPDGRRQRQEDPQHAGAAARADAQAPTSIPACRASPSRLRSTSS